MSDEKRREYPRIHLAKPGGLHLTVVRLVLDDAVWDVSQGGCQLRCDRAGARALHPGADPIKPGNWPQSVLGFRFPFPEGIPEIVVDCTLRYVRGTEDGLFAFGVKFENFQGQGTADFERFIHEALRYD